MAVVVGEIGGYCLFVGSAISFIVLGSGCGAENMGTTGYELVELLVQRIFPHSLI